MARTPLYKTAETTLIEKITSGVWEVGHRLPNEFQLADEFGVSQGTMRRALINLESMGLLNRKPGRGTIIASNSPVTKDATSAGEPVFRDADRQAVEFEPFRARLEKRRTSDDEALLLGDENVVELSRTLRIGSTRVALDQVVIVESYLSSLPEDGDALLHQILTAHDAPATDLRHEIGAEMTDMAQSVALSVDRHTALLTLTTTAFDSDGKAYARQKLLVAKPGVSLALE